MWFFRAGKGSVGSVSTVVMDGVCGSCYCSVINCVSQFMMKEWAKELNSRPVTMKTSWEVGLVVSSKGC